MKTMRIIGTLAVAGLVAAGCEDITNPVEEFGQFAPPWVGFDATTANGPHGSTIPVVFEAPTRPEEDVVIDVTFGGNAVFGEDYVIVDADGNVRTDVTAAGATISIPYDPHLSEPHDTLWVFIPTDATVGRTLEILISDARTASGEAVTVGHVGSFDTYTLTITAAPAEIPVGSYAGPISGDLGEGNVTVAVTDNPVTIGGTQYRYRMNDFAAGIFGQPIPWAFNVLSDGTVNFSPSAVGFNVTADITGTFDFETNTLSFDTLLTCCGGSGLEWRQVLTLQ